MIQGYCKKCLCEVELVEEKSEPHIRGLCSLCGAFVKWIPKDKSSFYDSTKIYNEMQMPYGKHRGKLIRKIPVDYLKWLYSEMEESIDSKLKRAIQHAITRADAEDS